MNKVEFTPGPYRAINAKEYCAIFGYLNEKDSPIIGDDICIITDEDDPWIICTVHSAQPGERGPDARLIVAAPEMFDFLQMVVDNPAFANEALREKAGELINKITKDDV